MAEPLLVLGEFVVQEFVLHDVVRATGHVFFPPLLQMPA